MRYKALYRPAILWCVSFIFISASCKKEAKAPNPGEQQATTFTNPLLNAAPDPYVYQKDSTYYYLHTLGNRIQIWKTNKMSRLKDVTPVTVFNAPATGGNSRDIWAPELFFLNGKWYIYYTGTDGNDREHRMWVLENANPDPTQGTWTDKGKLTTKPADLWSIDATIFQRDSSLFLIWSGRPFAGGSTDLTQNIYISQMSNPFTLTGPTVLISTPQYDWEKRGFAVNEGPEILRNAAGRDFLVFSGSYCGNDQYALGMMSLKAGSNPSDAKSWTKMPAPVFTGLASANAFGAGHNGFFKSRDGKEDWIIYHANSAAGEGCDDSRNVRMQKFAWTAEGLPSFGEPVSTGQSLAVPSGE
ncbi:glycoside hydrolase family 43 protein [Dyadobacter fanqingshengii]|uniref:Glycoside hydrolase family 43 protein n=1 Tax=Dyadobacter fanqingshengii TaxID=2906443 RepID=A0A9X1PCI1_9BACT|nr:glycoside hydrolase family 43 protein [Dyadobacter fanqingshengii]MCF0042010.1 glycoside hydrolase family 43 protein [Dyadobacter fanqingshengii]USJ36287.1 glycoside hydrolase family 43 protein [Dyadobacter fanqingshengii]